MDKKIYTFLILPGLQRKLIKIEISRYTIYFSMAVAAVLVVTLGVLAITYTRMLMKVSDYNSLRAGGESLRNKYATLLSKVDDTNDKLDSIQSLARDVAVSYTFARYRTRQLPARNVTLAAEFLPGVGSRYAASFQALSVLKSSVLAQPADLVKALFATGIDSSKMSPKPSIWPVRGYVTSHFGQRIDPFLGEGMFHPGTDIYAPYRSAVMSPADGLVIFTGSRPGYGNLVIVSHGYGISTKMAHLSKIAATIGQEVRRGQTVGYVGSSGRATGPHLHYEVLVNEIPVNPAKYLKRQARQQIAQLLVSSPPS